MQLAFFSDIVKSSLLRFKKFSKRFERIRNNWNFIFIRTWFWKKETKCYGFSLHSIRFCLFFWRRPLVFRTNFTSQFITNREKYSAFRRIGKIELLIFACYFCVFWKKSGLSLSPLRYPSRKSPPPSTIYRFLATQPMTRFDDLYCFLFWLGARQTLEKTNKRNTQKPDTPSLKTISFCLCIWYSSKNTRKSFPP